MVRKLRATEEHLTQALNNREETPLVNSMHDRGILKRAGLVQGVGLERIFPFPGMKGPIKAILETYNAKFPGLDARFFKHMEKAMSTASGSLERGQTLRGLAVYYGCHATAVEFRCHADNRISMLVLDSMQGHEIQPANCAIALGMPRYNQGGRIDAAVFCGLDVQKDYSSCAAYTKDFLKEMHRHGDEFATLHADTRTWAREPETARSRELLPGIERYREDAPVFFLPPDKAQQALPLQLFKNPQSAERLAEILNNRRYAESEWINAKGEVIPERLQRMTGKEWVSRNPDTGTYEKVELEIGDKVVPIAKNYQRMHRKSADYGETGQVRRHAPDQPGTALG
jgi:hypothetical protein